MNACEITAAVTALANIMSEQLDENETALLSAVFVRLGDTLATIAAQKAVCTRIPDRSCS